MALSIVLTLCVCCEYITGAVVGVCLCEPQTQANLQQWIKQLQLSHPYFKDATIVYSILTSDSSIPSNLLETANAVSKVVSGPDDYDVFCACVLLCYKSVRGHVFFLFGALPSWRCEVW